MMKLKLLVLVVIFTIYVSQNPTGGSRNFGVSVKNITRKAENETCQGGGNDCKYFLDLCLSYFPEKCSIFSPLRTFSWVIKPGTSKILRLWHDDLTRTVYNPIMVNFERWQNKDVILDVNVSRHDTKDVLVDRIQIKTRLPYPINDVKKIDVQENYKSNCGQFFCLGVLIYAWCDDVIACAGPRPTSSSSVLPTTSFPKETSSFTSLTASQSFFKSSQAVNQPFQAAPKEHPNVNPTKSYETRSWDKTSSRSKTTKQPAVPRAGEARGNDGTQHWWVWVGIPFLIVLFLVVVTGFVFLRIKRRSKAKKAKISVELKKTEAKENYGFSGSM